MHFPMDSAAHPSQCAGGPFARVVKSWISDDQTVPTRLHTRHIDAPVRALTLDFDFSKIPERYGNADLFSLAFIILYAAMAKCTSPHRPQTPKHNEMQ
jgi:hypothetical protein